MTLVGITCDLRLRVVCANLTDFRDPLDTTNLLNMLDSYFFGFVYPSCFGTSSRTFSSQCCNISNKLYHFTSSLFSRCLELKFSFPCCALVCGVIISDSSINPLIDCHITFNVTALLVVNDKYFPSSDNHLLTTLYQHAYLLQTHSLLASYPRRI